MKKQFKLAVYIGRFQPIHRGHLANIQKGLDLAEQVLVLIGSAGASPSPRNPLDAITRADLMYTGLYDMLPPEEVNRVSHEYIKDHTYNDSAWVVEVTTAILRNSNRGQPAPEEIVLIGHKKDATSVYLDYFPQYSFIESEPFIVDGNLVSSTFLREQFFESGSWYDMPMLIPQSITRKLRSEVDIFRLVEEWNSIREYRKSWETAPYPPIFVTTDAVVVQSGHILLVQRKDAPGKGLWALPGGFLGQDETIIDSMVRELREETKLKVPVKVLKGSIRKNRAFDSPTRSQRGRTITHAFYIHLDDAETLPKVKGGDDAAHAQWVSFGQFELMSHLMFEDHWHIVNCLVFGR